MESNYEQLVKALRLCQFGECGCGKCRYNTLKGDWGTEENHPEFFDCDDKLKLDAAAAIEYLKAENETLHQHIEDLNGAFRIESEARQKAEAAQPHWVSVDDPPKFSGKVFVWRDIVGDFYDREYTFDVAYYNGLAGGPIPKGTFFRPIPGTTDYRVLDDVIYWWRPEPPKEEA